MCRDGQGAVIRVAILSFQTTRSCPFTFDLWLQGWYFGPKTCLLAVSLSHLTVVCQEMVEMEKSIDQSAEKTQTNLSKMVEPCQIRLSN